MQQARKGSSSEVMLLAYDTQLHTQSTEFATPQAWRIQYSEVTHPLTHLARYHNTDGLLPDRVVF